MHEDRRASQIGAAAEGGMIERGGTQDGRRRAQTIWREWFRDWAGPQPAASGRGDLQIGGHLVARSGRGSGR